MDRLLRLIAHLSLLFFTAVDARAQTPQLVVLKVQGDVSMMVDGKPVVLKYLMEVPATATIKLAGKKAYLKLVIDDFEQPIEFRTAGEFLVSEYMDKRSNKRSSTGIWADSVRHEKEVPQVTPGGTEVRNGQFVEPRHSGARDTADKLVIGTFFIQDKQSAEKEEEVEVLAGLLNEALQRNPEVVVLPRSTEFLSSTERSEKWNADYVRGKIAEQGKAMGARYLLLGELQELSVDVGAGSLPDPPTAKANGSTVAQSTFVLNIVDVTSGVSIGRDVIKVKGTGGIGFAGSARSNAITAMNKAAMRRISNWTANVLGTGPRIVAVNSIDAKGNPKSLLVMGLSQADGLEQAKLDVIRVFTLNGVRVTEKVSEIKVKGVTGEIAECVVSRGARELKDSLDAKEELVVLYRENGD